MEYKIQEETLTAIADAIRQKTGTQNQYTPTEMPGAIENIPSGGGGGGGGGGDTIIAIQIKAYRGTNDYGQIQEIYFYDQNQNRLTVTATAETDILQLGTAQSVDHVIDGDLNSKWTFKRVLPNNQPDVKILYIKITGECKPSYISYVTGDDYADRDPISFKAWHIYGTTIQCILEVENATIPTARKTETQLFPCTYTGGGSSN